MATPEDPRAPSAEPGRRGPSEADAVRGVDEWRRELYEATNERGGELFTTLSGLENEPLYTPDNVDVDYERDLG